MRLIEVGGVSLQSDPMEILEKLEKMLDKQIKKSKKQLKGGLSKMDEYQKYLTEVMVILSRLSI